MNYPILPIYYSLLYPTPKIQINYFASNWLISSAEVVKSSISIKNSNNCSYDELWGKGTRNQSYPWILALDDFYYDNGLVSVFLRKLEYYKGILFLTTNRVAQFDEAILSRIHLLLRYEDLTRVARRQVWRNFLSRVATSSLIEKELEELAISPLNGRQVSYLTKPQPSSHQYPLR